MFNITDYVNTSKINDAINDMSNITFDQVKNQGLLSIGFNPYVVIFGSWLWGLTFGLIAVGIYSWKGIYPTIGFLAVILLITSAIIPIALGNMFAVFLGFLIASIFYEVLVVKKKNKTKGV